MMINNFEIKYGYSLKKIVVFIASFFKIFLPLNIIHLLLSSTYKRFYCKGRKVYFEAHKRAHKRVSIVAYLMYQIIE